MLIFTLPSAEGITVGDGPVHLVVSVMLWLVTEWEYLPVLGLSCASLVLTLR